MNCSPALRHRRINALYCPPHFSSSSSSAMAAASGLGAVYIGFRSFRCVYWFQILPERIPLFPRHQAERVADQMNDACLHDSVRPDALHHLRQTFEAIAHEEEHVAYAAILQADEHAHRPTWRPRRHRCPSSVPARPCGPPP